MTTLYFSPEERSAVVQVTTWQHGDKTNQYFGCRSLSEAHAFMDGYKAGLWDDYKAKVGEDYFARPYRPDIVPLPEPTRAITMGIIEGASLT